MSRIDTRDKLINAIIKELEYENSSYGGRVKKLNIPFLIAPLYQCLTDNSYRDFIEDVKECLYYSISYHEDTTKGYTNGHVEIAPEDKEYYYNIYFPIDERNYGYCECTPDDEDYREDKKCCGYSCDWYAPAVSIEKVYYIGYSSWNGNQNNFWEFEDNFYKSNEQLADEKKKADRQARITYIQDNIKELLTELEKLEKEE